MRIFAAVALACSVLVSPAAAQQRSWSEYPIDGGCTIVLRRPLAADVTASWAPNCVAGQPVNGPGRLSMVFHSTGRTVTLDGNFIAGVPHGPATLTGVITATGQVFHSEPAEYDMGCDVTGNGCIPYAPR